MRPIMSGTIVAALLVATAGLHLGNSADSAVLTTYQVPIQQLVGYRLASKVPEAPAPREPATAVALALPLPAPLLLFAGKPYSTEIHLAAQDANIDPALVHAVISVESGYDAAARSPKGAIGLMQVMPETAMRYGIKDPAKSPAANLRAGTRYLRDLMQQFDGRLDLVLAAYNAGENAVLRYGRQIPPFKETQQYVPKVLSKYREWRTLPVEVPVLVDATPPLPPPPAPRSIDYLAGTRLSPDRTQATLSAWRKPLAFTTTVQ